MSSAFLRAVCHTHLTIVVFRKLERLWRTFRKLHCTKQCTFTWVPKILMELGNRRSNGIRQGSVLGVIHYRNVIVVSPAHPNTESRFSPFSSPLFVILLNEMLLAILYDIPPHPWRPCLRCSGNAEAVVLAQYQLV